MIWIKAEICDELRTTCPTKLPLGQVVPPIYPENLVHLEQSKNSVIQLVVIEQACRLEIYFYSSF